MTDERSSAGVGAEGAADDAADADSLVDGRLATLGEATQAASELVDASERIVVLTGAGISTDSRIPDYRGPQGVWTRNPEAEKQATLQNYLADPEVRRRAWRNRLDSPIWAAEPNRGHFTLTQLEARRKLHLLITQNVDGLHQLAGSNPDKVVEVHGTVREVGCMSCTYLVPMQKVLDRVRLGEDDPECPDCSGILKSATISFGQSLVAEDLHRAQLAAEACDLLLAVGSTLAVYPIANAVPIAKSTGSAVVIVNGSPTEMDELGDVVVRGSISDVLPLIV
ncbi:MAG: Sir2 family NAD-dependent protein deacetylase [Acidimicrobiia bacterium]|nr:Sir2 family NAD-dependent protein deacetylase [Acidimicrobiia bacterium]